MYTSSISLETRLLLLTGEKAFCSCKKTEGRMPSCPVCRGETVHGLVLNERAIHSAILLARALDCSIEEEVVWERNTTTPEVPSSVSITGLSVRLAVNGYISVFFHGRRRDIRITELRIEEDAGRLTHSGKQTRMDYSNAGLPSLRIRTEADMEIGEEAELFLDELRARIQYLGIVPNMALEQILRSNARVSVYEYPGIPRVFVKLRNLNSFNFARKAINAELLRQEGLLSSGGVVESESRLWNEQRETTESFRKRKPDEAPVFIPVSGLDPWIPDSALVEALTTKAPDLPEARRRRFSASYGLPPALAATIANEKTRADFYEKTLELGASARDAAFWLTSFVLKELSARSLSLSNTALSPKRFAAVLSLLEDKRINNQICRKLLSVVITEDKDPLDIMHANAWELITDRETLEKLVNRILEENPEKVALVRKGEGKPLKYLTGMIMRETKGLAEPALVREILRERLSVSLVYVLSMGGAISGRLNRDGFIEAGEASVTESLVNDIVRQNDSLQARVEPLHLGCILSEDIVPSDWAALITAISLKLESGTANGIVITHGTDTLAYTAPLIYWLFAGAKTPIIFASSSQVPSEGALAKKSLGIALKLAGEKQNGVYVVHDGEQLSPLNLKYERPGPGGFRNWNGKSPVHEGISMLDSSVDLDSFVLTQLIEEAVNGMYVVRIYPGMRSDLLVSLIEKGVHTMFLELWDSGTACFREGPYSLRKLLSFGRKRGVRFYCSSQQESAANLSAYATAHELWREGVIPMGAMTTESAIARYIAASIVADDEEERASLMEDQVVAVE